MLASLRFLVGVSFLAVSLLGCRDDKDACEEYCEAAEDCAEVNDQPLSITECKFNCKVEREKHESMLCGYEWEHFLDCMIDLSCTEWGNHTERCANDIQRIDSCWSS